MQNLTAQNTKQRKKRAAMGVKRSAATSGISRVLVAICITVIAGCKVDESKGSYYIKGTITENCNLTGPITISAKDILNNKPDRPVSKNNMIDEDEEEEKQGQEVREYNPVPGSTTITQTRDFVIFYSTTNQDVSVIEVSFKFTIAGGRWEKILTEKYDVSLLEYLEHSDGARILNLGTVELDCKGL